MTRLTAALVVGTLAISFVPGQCQFWGVSKTWSKGHGYTKSFMSSSVWKQGSDGRVHEQHHEVGHETIFGGPKAQDKHSEVTCKDGFCTKTVQVSRPPSAVAAWTPRLRGFFPWKAQPLLAQPPPVVINLRPQPYVGLRPLVATKVRPMPWASLAPAGLEQAAASQMVPVAVLALVGLMTTGLAVVAILGLRAQLSAGSTASARELPLRALGEPLAPVLEEPELPEVAPAKPTTAPPASQAVATARAVSVAYLSCMYGRAAQNADVLANQMYLFGLYERAGA